MLRDILGALQWLHGHSVSHRDDVRQNIASAAHRHLLADILIDSSESCRITLERMQTAFRGGYLCRPPGIIQEVSRSGTRAVIYVPGYSWSTAGFPAATGNSPERARADCACGHP